MIILGCFVGTTIYGNTHKCPCDSSSLFELLLPNQDLSFDAPEFPMGFVFFGAFFPPDWIQKETWYHIENPTLIRSIFDYWIIFLPLKKSTMIHVHVNYTRSPGLYWGILTRLQMSSGMRRPFSHAFFPGAEAPFNKKTGWFIRSFIMGINHHGPFVIP